MASPVAISSLSRLLLRPGLGDRNPSKTRVFPPAPATLARDANALAPGIGITLCPAFLASPARIAPGSLIPGVPASLA